MPCEGTWEYCPKCTPQTQVLSDTLEMKGFVVKHVRNDCRSLIAVWCSSVCCPQMFFSKAEAGISQIPGIEDSTVLCITHQ